MEVQQLHARQRYTDAMERLREAEALKPENAVVFNARGSIYTGMRDFDKAREWFKKSEALSPTAFEPKFNLTELDYVQGNYEVAGAGFSKLLADHPKLPLQVRHLTQFKVLVCSLKRDKIVEAEAMMKNFTFMDDTAAYYFAKAAFAYQKDDKALATEWVTKATKIFKPVEIAPYMDSLMEARWLPSLAVPNDPKK